MDDENFGPSLKFKYVAPARPPKACVGHFQSASAPNFMGLAPKMGANANAT